MKSKKHALSILVVVIIVGFLPGNMTACDIFWKTPTPVPTQTPTAVPTPTPTLLANIPAEVVAARDAALAFLRASYPDKAPPADTLWVGQNVTPPGVVGTSSYEFVSGDWLMLIGTPEVSPGNFIYEMELTSQQTGFHWTGTLDAHYAILESNLNVAIEVLIVREIVLSYVREHYLVEAPIGNLAWIGERTTPEGSIGHESCRFTAESWMMTVDYDLVSPEQVIYQIELSNANTAFVWRGQVDAEGTVLEHR